MRHSSAPAQLDALRLWMGAGGRLTILGGTTGVATVRGFGAELLPFDPQHTVDVAPADLVALLGQLPTDAAAVPAVAGILDHGAVLARSGDDVVAAEVGYGRGVVTPGRLQPGRTLDRRRPGQQPALAPPAAAGLGTGAQPAQPAR